MIFVPHACVVFTLLQVTHITPKCVADEPVLAIYSRCMINQFGVVYKKYMTEILPWVLCVPSVKLSFRK